MAYTPTVWASGDTIDAAKLNKIEQGIAGNALIVECSSTTPRTLDHTFAEIFNALNSGTPVFIKAGYLNGSDWSTQYDSYTAVTPVIYASKYADMYRIYVAWSGRVTTTTISTVNQVGSPGCLTFEASSINDYPTFIRQTYVNTSSLVVGAII